MEKKFMTIIHEGEVMEKPSLDLLRGGNTNSAGWCPIDIELPCLDCDLCFHLGCSGKIECNGYKPHCGMYGNEPCYKK